MAITLTLCHIWAETPTNHSSHATLASWEWQTSEMGFEKQTLNWSVLLSSRWWMVQGDPCWLEALYLFSCAILLQKHSTKRVQTRQYRWNRKAKATEDKNSERDNRKTRKWQLNRREKVIRELNFIFPELAQIQSLNTTKTISCVHIGRLRVSKPILSSAGEPAVHVTQGFTPDRRLRNLSVKPCSSSALMFSMGTERRL